MAGVVPRRRREVVENSSAEYFVEGNPNRQVAGAKGTPGYGKIQHSPGVPRVEYTKIEICKADLVRDERINRANRRLIKYYNEIRSSRIQILETEFERKVKVKGEAKPRGR